MQDVNASIAEVVAILFALLERWYPTQVKLERCVYGAKTLRRKYVNMARLNMKKSADIPALHKEALAEFSGDGVDAIFAEYATCTEDMSDEESWRWHVTGNDMSTEIVEAYILEAYRRHLDANAGDKTVEKCAEKIAILVPVRNHTADIV